MQPASCAENGPADPEIKAAKIVHGTTAGRHMQPASCVNNRTWGPPKKRTKKQKANLNLNKTPPSRRSDGVKTARNHAVRPQGTVTKPPMPALWASAHSSAKASHGKSGANARGKVGESNDMQEAHIERTSRDSGESLRLDSGGMRTEIQMRRSPEKTEGTSESVLTSRLLTETKEQPFGQLASPTSDRRRWSPDRPPREVAHFSGLTSRRRASLGNSKVAVKAQPQSGRSGRQKGNNRRRESMPARRDQ